MATVEAQRPVERLTPYSPMYGLQGRMAIYDPRLRGTPQDVLDINNRLVQVTPDKLAKNVGAFHEVFTIASKNESDTFWKGTPYEAAINKWRASFISGVSSRREYFTEKSHAEYFKQLGINGDDPDAQAQTNAIYKRYIDCENPKTRTLSFENAVLKTLAMQDGKFDKEKFMKERDGIEFMAAMYGAEGGDVAMQNIEARIDLANDAEEFVTRTQAAVNVVPRGSLEEQHLVYLHNAERDLMATPLPSPKKIEVPPPKQTPPPRNNPLPPEKKLIIPPGKSDERKEPVDELANLEKRFAAIPTPPDLDHSYAITDIDSKLENAQNSPFGDLSNYEYPQPFFELKKGGMGPTVEAAPYLFDLGDYTRDDVLRPTAERNQRFEAAEAATNGDSGLFAIAAASANTPYEQTELYAFLTAAVLEVHRNNPLLLRKWLDAQTDASRFLFTQFDDERKEPNEKLFVIENGEINNEKTATLWQPRLQEIGRDFPSDTLKDYQIRWIELLSHSVKIPELIKKLQEVK